MTTSTITFVPRREAVQTHVLPPHIVQYQQGVDRMRISPYLDYPAHVHLETFAQCNASCNFCPYPTMDRKGERMPDALIEKVIGELTDIPSNLPFQLSPFKVNEPFLDTRIFDVLELAHKKLPNASITLTSNSQPITPAKLARLATFDRIGYLWISFNSHEPAEYERVMGISFAKTLERLHMLHEYAAGGGRIRIVTSRVGDGSIRDQEFVQWIRQNFPHFEPSVFPRGGWIGQVPSNEQAPIYGVGCVRWFDLSITATGVVAHCCMDGRAEHPIGDVSKQHVLEVYNAPEYRRLREYTATRLEAEPCNKCAFL